MVLQQDYDRLKRSSQHDIEKRDKEIERLRERVNFLENHSHNKLLRAVRLLSQSESELSPKAAWLIEQIDDFLQEVTT